MTSRPEVFRRAREESAAQDGGHVRFPKKPFPHSMLMVFKEYSYDSQFTQGGASRVSSQTQSLGSAGRLSGQLKGGVNLRSSKAIELPFPKQLSDQTQLQVNGFSRDPLIEKAAGAINNFAAGGSLGDIPGQIQGMGAAAAGALAGGGGEGGLGGMIQGIIGKIGDISTGDAATSAQYLLRNLVNSTGQIGQSVNLATGQVLNPRETLAFEGVGLRQHQFTWELFPQNLGDTNQIKEIVKTLKQCILPVTQDLGTGDNAIAKAFLRYPHVCEIFLIGVAQDAFIQFKPCIVTNMTVDYGPGGQVSMMTGGVPAGVSLQLSLQELSIETANDYGADSAAAAEAPELRVEPPSEPAETVPTAFPRGVTTA